MSGCGEDPVDLPPMVVTGYTIPGPSYYWMGGGSWYYYLHGGAGGGTSANNISQPKLDFCLLEGTFQAIYDHWPILSDISSIEAYANTAANIQQLIYEGALRDIIQYVGSGGVTHAPPTYTSENTINWYNININWLQYGNDPNGGSMTRNDAIPIFSNFLLQMGLGNGTVDLEAAGNDPDPSVDCG